MQQVTPSRQITPAIRRRSGVMSSAKRGPAVPASPVRPVSVSDISSDTARLLCLVCYSMHLHTARYSNSSCSSFRISAKCGLALPASPVHSERSRAAHALTPSHDEKHHAPAFSLTLVRCGHTSSHSSKDVQPRDGDVPLPYDV